MCVSERVRERGRATNSDSEREKERAGETQTEIDGYRERETDRGAEPASAWKVPTSNVM